MSSALMSCFMSSAFTNPTERNTLLRFSGPCVRGMFDACIHTPCITLLERTHLTACSTPLADTTPVAARGVVLGMVWWLRYCTRVCVRRHIRVYVACSGARTWLLLLSLQRPVVAYVCHLSLRMRMCLCVCVCVFACACLCVYIHTYIRKHT